MALKRYAGNCLYDLEGKYWRTCIVELNAEEHTLIRFLPFNGTELPSTEWIGGCFILSTKENLPTPHKTWTLGDLVKILCHPDSEVKANRKKMLPGINDKPVQIYVWHTSVTQAERFVARIQRL